MQGPHRRKNCHQDIFQWTEEIAIAWGKLRAVRRVINKVPLKFQNSLLGFRGSMRSGIFYAVSNLLLNRPSRFLRTESASICRTVQYGSLTISTGFWKWKSSTPWKSQKVSTTFPADNTTSNILVTSEPGCYHCMDASFDSVWKWRAHDSFVEYVFVLRLVVRKCSISSPIHVILCSWFSSTANTWRKFSKVQTIPHYAVGHFTRTHKASAMSPIITRLSARNIDSTWLTADLLRFPPVNPVCYWPTVSNVLARISQLSCKQPYPTKYSHHTQEAWLMNILGHMSFRLGKKNTACCSAT